MKRIIITLIVLMGCANFIAQAQNTAYSQSSSGIWFEARTDSLNPCHYTEDNKIYQADREFTFEFHYFDPQGKERYMRYERVPIQRQELTETGDTITNTYYSPDFSFSDKFDAKDSCINRYLVKVSCSRRVFRKDYNQTVEEFYFLLDGQRSKLPISMSGIVENERNLWMHPNRSCLFRILELNPFRISNTPSKKERLGNGNSPSAATGATSVGKPGRAASSISISTRLPKRIARWSHRWVHFRA